MNDSRPEDASSERQPFDPVREALDAAAFLFLDGMGRIVGMRGRRAPGTQPQLVRMNRRERRRAAAQARKQARQRGRR